MTFVVTQVRENTSHTATDRKWRQKEKTHVSLLRPCLSRACSLLPSTTGEGCAIAVFGVWNERTGGQLITTYTVYQYNVARFTVYS